MKEYNRFLGSGLTWDEYLNGATDGQLSRMIYDLMTIKQRVWQEKEKRVRVLKDKEAVEKYGDFVWVFEFDGVCNWTKGVTPNRVLECDSNFMSIRQAIAAIMARHPTAKIGDHELRVGTVRVWFEVEEV